MKKVLIVGGSKGIGNSILKNGINDYKFINISRSEPKIAHENLKHYSLDILKDDLPEIDELDALVFCPGSITLKPISMLKEDDFINDFNINVLAAVKVIKNYIQLLKKSDDGNIVLFSSVAVSQGMPFHSSIAVAKAGVEALSKSLAAELAPRIRVNCIAPSITDTKLAAGILRSEKQRDSISKKHPLQKILSPNEVAQTALFLLSNMATGITGQIIGVDAGLGSLKL